MAGFFLNILIMYGQWNLFIAATRRSLIFDFIVFVFLLCFRFPAGPSQKVHNLTRFFFKRVFFEFRPKLFYKQPVLTKEVTT